MKVEHHRFACHDLEGWESLTHLLRTTPLDPRFEDYGDFLQDLRGESEACQVRDGVRYRYLLWGNFFEVSAGFSVVFEGGEPELDEAIALIQANKRTQAYADAKRAIAESARKWAEIGAARERKRREDRESDARRVLGLL